MSYQAVPPGSCGTGLSSAQLSSALRSCIIDWHTDRQQGKKMKGKEEVTVDAVEDGDKAASWGSLLSGVERACPSVCVCVRDGDIRVPRSRSCSSLSHTTFPVFHSLPVVCSSHFIYVSLLMSLVCVPIWLISWRCHLGEELQPGGEAVKKGRSDGGGGSRWTASHLSSGHSFSSLLFYKNKSKNLEPCWQLCEAARRPSCALS